MSNSAAQTIVDLFERRVAQAADAVALHAPLRTATLCEHGARLATMLIGLRRLSRKRAWRVATP